MREDGKGRRLIRWAIRGGIAAGIVGGFLFPPIPSAPPQSEAPRTAVAAHVETSPGDPELTRYANELWEGRGEVRSERYARESDPEKLVGLALELGSSKDRETESELVRQVLYGDALHQEHALLALMGHSDEPAVEAMLTAADLSRPAEVADRALDALLSVADGLQDPHRSQARDKARLLADCGDPSARVTALLLLAELGTGEEDRLRLESLSVHEDSRIALAAKRAWIEYLRGRGESDVASKVWDTLPWDSAVGEGER